MSDDVGPPPPRYRLLRATLTLALLGLLALSLAGFLGRWSWHLDLCSHFRPHYLAGSLLLGGLALAARRRGPVALAAAGLALNLVALTAGLGAPVPVDGPALRLLVHNVYTPNDRYAEVAAAARAFEADVLCLQELDRAWLVGLQEAGLGDLDPVLLEPRQDNFGIGVWLRPRAGLELVGHELLRLSEHELPALSLRLRVDGRPLELLVLHTLPPVSEENGDVRASQLQAAAARAAACQGPFVLTGDLNATPWSRDFDALREAGFADPLTGLGGSWPTFYPELAGIPIDHCLLKGPVSATDARYGAGAGSDHRALLVTLAVGE
ncbi:MAG: endonuclease/exonuclease/phosphatase family protein [Planctomycetota bacterium]